MTTLGGSLLAHSRYEAIAVIQLLPRAGQEMAAAEVVTTEGGYYEARDRARTQMQIIQSRSVREEVVRRYNSIGGDQLDASADGLDELLSAMTVTPREDTQLVEIRVLDTDPARAARLANLVAEVYCDANLEARTDAARKAREWLAGRGESARAALQQAESRVLSFQSEHAQVDLDATEDGISARRKALQAALGATTTERVQLQSRLEEHQRILDRGDAALLTGAFDEPVLKELARQHAAVIGRNAEILSRYGDNHPEHKRAMSEGRRMEALLTEAVKRSVAGERARIDQLGHEEARLRGELGTTKAEQLEKQEIAARYAELRVDLDRARRVYAAIADREADVELQAESRLNDVRVVDPARPPTRAVTPDIPLNLSVALGIGLAGGIGLVLARERLDDTIRSERGARSLGVTLLGTLAHVDAESAAARALHPPDRTWADAAEVVRVLADAPTRSAPTDGRRCIAVTSGAEGEGRTHVAISLALAFAELGARVLLVDAERRHPQLHARLGGPEFPGLGDALHDPRSACRYVRPTPVRGLHLLAAGSRVPGADQGFGSPRWELLLSRLGESWPVVIVDGPAVRDGTEACTLASRVDAVVVVLRGGVTSRRSAVETLDALSRAGAPLVGVVLDDVPAASRPALQLAALP